MLSASQKLIYALSSILFSGCPCMPASVRDHMLKVFERGVLQTVCGNFTKFTTNVQFSTKMNQFFEVKRYWSR